MAADVTTYRVPDHERFDLILVNSLLHHLDDSSIIRLLTHLSGLVTADGRVHILELVMPEHRSVARFLARQDRGRYVRPLSTWSSLIGTVMSPVMVEPYDVGVQV